MLNRVLCVVAALAAAARPALAVDPPARVLLNHTGRLLDADDNPVDGTHTLKFTLYRGAVGVSFVWEDELQVNVVKGIYALTLGDVDAGGEELTLDDFDGSERWLGIKVDGVELNPRLLLGVVPYAVHALNADHAAAADAATHATSADSATNAGHATSADSATNAGHATAADSATNATHAASADSATTATTATNLSGGSVDATSIKINGSTVIDGTGQFQGPTTSLNADKLDDLDSTAFALAGHDHDARYYTKAQLDTPAGGDTLKSVDWARLKSVPAGFADGDDANSGGTLTGITTSGGLTGSGASGSVALGVNTAQIQKRVTGACTSGDTIKAINEDGTVACETARPVNDVYTHWGFDTCASGDTVLYAGYAYAGWYDHIGGTPNPVCFKAGDPGPAYNASNHGSYLVALGMYYTGNDTSHQAAGVTNRRSIPCAICATKKVCTQMVGTQTCPTNWTAAYAGELVGAHYNWEHDFESFCYELNNTAATTPQANLNQIFAASTGDGSYMMTGIDSYRHVKCAICCR
jgi:hypothetical protein